MDESKAVHLSKIHVPGGALGYIHQAYVQLGYRCAPSHWMDAHSIPLLLSTQPVTVRAVDQHFEVVSGFRSFQIAQLICEQKDEIEVQLSQKPEERLIELALFELISTHLLYTLEGVKAAREIYRVLKQLRRQLPEYTQTTLPHIRTLNDLKAVLRLNNDKVKQPKSRHSELTKVLQRSKA